MNPHKPRYRTTNWPEYNRSLQNRGNLKESQLIGEIGAQATQIVITQMSMPVREKEAEAAKAEKAGDTVGAARLKAEAAALDKEIQAKWGMGSDFQRAAQAVTAALQGLSGGN